jgi:hypothetical protein
MRGGSVGGIGLAMRVFEQWRTAVKPSRRLCTAEVRGSNPLDCTYRKWLRWALVRDTKHQDGNVVTGVLLLEVQNGTLYSAGHSRSVESN